MSIWTKLNSNIGVTFYSAIVREPFEGATNQDGVAAFRFKIELSE